MEWRLHIEGCILKTTKQRSLFKVEGVGGCGWSYFCFLFLGGEDGLTLFVPYTRIRTVGNGDFLCNDDEDHDDDDNGDDDNNKMTTTAKTTRTSKNKQKKDNHNKDNNQKIIFK